MSRWIRALLCLVGEHPGGFYLAQGLFADRYRCSACGRVYAKPART